MSGLLQQISLPANEIPWLKEMRARGAEVFASHGIPTAKTEAWKYTKPRGLNVDDFVLSLPREEMNTPEAALSFEAYRIYFENGIFNPFLSNLPQGVEVLPLLEVIMFHPQYRKLINAGIDMEKYPFAALNTAYLNEGVFIHIDSNVDLKKPLAIIYHTSGSEENLFYNLHNLFLLETGASANLVEYHTYTGDVKASYFANIVNDVFLSQGSRLNHYKAQDEAYKATHIALNYVRVNSDAAYHSFCMQRGADMARNETHVLLQAKGSSAEINAAYIMNGWATIDTTTDIEHLSPCTNSNQLIKGVIGGNAKGVFQGKIHIAPNAVQTEGNQLHKALLLTDTAEVDVKPELEIFADDVKCSHGAASGELDEDQLFYMRSRGIGEDEAKELLIAAYLSDAISKIEDEKIREWITSLAK